MQSFNKLIAQLAANTKMSLPKEGFRTCLFTDDSDSHWCAILTQSPNIDACRPIEDQVHEPMYFLLGPFIVSAER